MNLVALTVVPVLFKLLSSPGCCFWKVVRLFHTLPFFLDFWKRLYQIVSIDPGVIAVFSVPK